MVKSRVTRQQLCAEGGSFVNRQHVLSDSAKLQEIRCQNHLWVIGGEFSQVLCDVAVFLLTNAPCGSFVPAHSQPSGKTSSFSNQYVHFRCCQGQPGVSLVSCRLLVVQAWLFECGQQDAVGACFDQPFSGCIAWEFQPLVDMVADSHPALRWCRVLGSSSSDRCESNESHFVRDYDTIQ